MSMEVRTILELIEVFAAYTACVFLAPYFVFYTPLRNKSLAEKFILCTLIGNFYIINVIFFIFLIGIPGKVTLFLFILLPAFLAWRQINRPDIRHFFIFLYTAISRLFLGEAKIHTIWILLSKEPKRRLKRAVRSIFSHFFHHIIEWGFMTGLLSFNVWYYGYHIVTRYSYGASDLPVHHWWVNELSNGTIFCNGIYPFGFHNMIYFIHTFFGMKTVSVMNAFGVVQTIYIYLMLYLLLRKICRSRYTPIIGVFLFTLPDLYSTLSTWRYQCALPQEFGMIFLYPCAYFLIQFFQRKKEEIQTEKEWKQKKKLYAWLEQYHVLPSTRSLIFFAMSFSLTLAAHFYITIIAVILCLAVAIAYFPIVLYPRYFWSIALAGILSLFSAIAPMGVAYMQGTPLQGSLEWALGVMNSGSSEEASAPEESDSPEEATIAPSESVVKSTAPASGNSNSIQPPSTAASEKPGLPERIAHTIQRIPTLAKSYVEKLSYSIRLFNDKASIFLCNVCNGHTVTKILVYTMEGLLVFPLLAIMIRRKYYYRNLLFVGIYAFFLILLCCAQVFHLPSVMELTRSSIFMAYSVPLLGACVIDVFYVILCRPFRYHRLTEILPIGLTAALIFLTISNNYVKPLNIIFSTQASGEVHCNYEIMENYPEKTWTVVTTTNSLQIVRDKGWHMELCTFLNKMQNYTSKTRITIPTKYVFFYIEKTPVYNGFADFVTNPIVNSGSVSKESAAQDAIYAGGDAYSMPNRHILESKFFYWAKAFQEKYPQEFQVYYEDDSFICYRMIQNEYNLYNFAIDYGFNK